MLTNVQKIELQMNSLVEIIESQISYTVNIMLNTVVFLYIQVSKNIFLHIEHFLID